MYDAIALTETFLSPGNPDTPFRLEGFNFLRQDRIGKDGSGVALYVRDCYKSKILASSNHQFDNKPEYLIVEVKHESTKILIVVVYRRPHAAYPTTLFELLSDLLPKYSDLIITGDFNFPMHRSHPDSLYFSNLLLEHSLDLVPSEPTHHVLREDGTQSSTWLDLFIVPSLTLVRTYTKTDTPFAAGHDLISLEYCFPSLNMKTKVVSSRNLKGLNLDHFYNELASRLTLNLPAEPAISAISDLPTGSHLESPTLSVITKALTSSLLDTYDALAPCRTITIRPKNKPWISADIRTLMEAKRAAYRRARTSGRPSDRLAFVALRARVSNSIGVAKNRHYSTILDATTDPKSVWNQLKSMGVTTPKTPSPIKYFSPQILNQHYAAVSRASSPLQPSDVAEIIKCPLSSSHPSLFEFSPISGEDVDRALSKATKNCTGSDLLSTDMLKVAYPVLRPQLVEIFNKSIEHGHFPESWKLASILPLSKTHPPNSPSDTRPIALLPELSKLLERIIHKQLLSYLTTHQLLDARQSGFRPRHSTQTALLGFTEEVRIAIDQRKVTPLILFDFSKAFDTVSHKLILRKLRALNCSIRVIKWFASYLMGRSQAIRGEGDSLSDPISTFAGVPQGSVLGPLLFAIFINDLPNVLVHTRHGIYADDTRIYLHCKPSELAEHIERLNDDASRVFDWAQNNMIRLNPEKTKLIILGSQPYVANIDLTTLPRVVIDGVAVSYSSHVTDLGCQLTANLSWDKHISRISSRVHGALYSLRFHRHALSRSLRKRLVESLIFPHIDYVCVVYNDLTKEQNLKLHRLLNTCVRFVQGYIPWQAPVTPYRLSLNWLSVENRRLLFTVLLAFTVISTGQPSYLYDLFMLRSNTLPRRITPRHTPAPLLLATPRTRALEASFHFTATKFINSMADQKITFEINSLQQFKSTARKILTHDEVLQWRSRVLRDTNLAINPLPHDATLTSLLSM